MSLETYRRKRDFRRTPEPKGKISKANRRRYVVQEHHASKLHFDFRLEMGGVLKSWSIPRGPSLDPSEKRLAVLTEDHPVDYLKFEGLIPSGQYGAGRHMIWDSGTYELSAGGDALEQFAAGRLKIKLEGKKLHGEFSLVRMARGRGEQWLLIKSRDERSQPGWTLELRLADDAQGAEFSKKERDSMSSPTIKKSGKKRGATDKKRAAGPVPASRIFKGSPASGDMDARIGRDVVSLTHLDKIYWPEDGYTKGDLVRYYYGVSKQILPYLKDRPLIMKRYPAGINGQHFHQHDAEDAPGYVRTIALEVEAGAGHHTVNYIVGGNLATLLYMSNLGAIESHPFHSRTRNLARPDWFVFDLDPGDGISYATICELALRVKETLARFGLECYAKTSGSRGLHIYVPIKAAYSYQDVARFAERVATIVAEENPEIATVERALKGRKKGQIYVDHLQNAQGKSVAAPYSVRPRPKATVSAPLDWREVGRKEITPRDFTIENMLARLSKKGDLFKPVLTNKQNLSAAMKKADK